MNKVRIIAAFLLAPLMTPLTFIITMAVRGNPLSSASDVPTIFVIYTPYAYLAVVILGIPAFILFRFLHLKNIIAYLLGGAGLGLVTALFVFRVVVSWSVASGDYGWCAVAGAASAMVFWLIAYGFGGTDTLRVPTNGET